MKKILSLIILLTFSFDSLSQRKQKKKNINANLISYDIPNLKWRSIGPYRGGRSATVTGTTNSKSTYYFGATGGGVWKTTNSGVTWNNISDGYFADLNIINLTSTIEIEQRLENAENFWEKLFPTIMMGDDRAIKSTWVSGKKIF